MDKQKWITVNGAKIPIDKDGNLQGKTGAKVELSKKQQQVKHAINQLVQGEQEVTVNNLRNDLEQYGGTNDVTFIAGNEKEGIAHIIENGRGHYLGDILDAVIEGKVDNKLSHSGRVCLVNKNVLAVLVLNREKHKKTWLLTGYDLTTDPKQEKKDWAEKKKKLSSDSKSEFHPTLEPTQTMPTYSRHCLGADESFKDIVAKYEKNATNKQLLAILSSLMDIADKIVDHIIIK